MNDIDVSLRDNCLILRFPETRNILSWAPFNGGLTKSNCILNWQIDKFDSGDIPALFKQKINQLGIPSHSVGMLTSAEIKNYQKAKSTIGSYEVRAIATVGLENTRTVGDSADVGPYTQDDHYGTINLVVACNALPDLQGMAEAIQVATMAKTKAMLDAGVVSRKSGHPATGTGTDCVVIAASGELKENYCGMHTPLGQLIGETVYQAIRKAIPSAL